MLKRASVVGLFIGIIGLLLASCNALPASEPRVRTELITVEIIITATPDPNSTPAVRIITATPDRTQVAIPDDLVPEDDAASSDDDDTNGAAVAQAGTSADGDEAAGDDDELQLPEGCIPYTIVEGDSPFGVAAEFEVNPFLLLQVNGLDEESSLRLQPGDQLIIPLEDCPVEELASFVTETPTPLPAEATEEATVEVTEEATEEFTATPTVTPTVTLPPTATDAQVEIRGVISADDITAEGVRLYNGGAAVEITGWTLSDLDGNEYTFNAGRIFSGSEIIVYTRTGTDTPVVRYWGLDEAVWQPGDVVVLRDNRGRVQASLRVEQPIELD